MEEILSVLFEFDQVNIDKSGGWFTVRAGEGEGHGDSFEKAIESLMRALQYKEEKLKTYQSILAKITPQ